jgi:hypothetical protein
MPTNDDSSGMRILCQPILQQAHVFVVQQSVRSTIELLGADENEPSGSCIHKYNTRASDLKPLVVDARR